MKKFSSLNENVNTDYNYIVIVEENYDDYYLFEKEKNVVNFVLNTIYGQFQGNKGVLDQFDSDDALNKVRESNDLEGLFQWYDDLQDGGFGGLSKMKYQEVKMLKNYELKDWIKIRKDVNKYNL